MSSPSRPGRKSPATRCDDGSLVLSSKSMDQNRGDGRSSQHRATIDKSCVVEKVQYKPTERNQKDLQSQVDPRHSQYKKLGHPLVKGSRHSLTDGLSRIEAVFDPQQPPAIDRYLKERTLEAARVRGEREMAMFLNRWEDKWNNK